MAAPVARDIIEAIRARRITGDPLYFASQTLAESIAGVTPINFNYPQGDVRRYGAVLDGVTNDTVALRNWALVGGDLIFPVAQTALITGQIPLASNSRLQFAKGSLIQTATPNINILIANTRSNVEIIGAHLKMTSAGVAVNVGGIYLTDCFGCVIEKCELEGMQFTGIFAQAVARCTFRGNYVHDSLGSGQDSTDINVQSSATNPSSYNLIEGNICSGGISEVGIAVWDPYSGVLSDHNTVANNIVTAHNGYGILFYMPDAGDTFNTAIGNHIQDISAHASNTSSGAGIYGVGAGLGGLSLIGNTIQNCCITTTAASLAPGGIGINGTSAGTVPLVINGNIIDGMLRYHGIFLTGVKGGASVTGNTVRMPVQTGTIGSGISQVNGNNIGITGNTITLSAGTINSVGITSSSNTANSSNISISGNTINGGHFAQIRFVQVGGFATLGGTISGNILNGADNSCIPLRLESLSAQDMAITGNRINGGNAVTVSMTNCTNMQFANNVVNGIGAVVLSTSGTCTGSYWDKTNSGSGTGATTSNAATGFIIEQLGSAAPVAGTWAVGDRVEQSVPVVGNPKGWRCTAAGAPGTWVSEGNL